MDFKNTEEAEAAYKMAGGNKDRAMGILLSAREVSIDNLGVSEPCNPVSDFLGAHKPCTSVGSAPLMQIDVMIDKTRGGRLGLNVTITDDKKIRIDGVGDETTLGGQWNASNPADKICAGDILAELNGVKDDPHQIIAEIKKNQYLSFVF